MSDPRIMRLALGTAQFGLDYGISNQKGQVSPGEITRILVLARTAGISKIDTAAAYGNSESALGSQPLEGFQVTTKTWPGLIAENDIIDRFKRSLEHLRLASVHGLLVHHAGDLKGQGGQTYWQALQALKAQGFVQQIGFSCYVEDDPLELAKHFQPDMVQVPVSLLDQRLVRDGTLDRLKAMGITITARSVFLQGLILMKPANIPSTLLNARQYIQLIADQARSLGVSPLSLALNFALDLKAVDHILIGVTNGEELREIIQAAQADLVPYDTSRLRCDVPAILNPGLWPKSVN